MDIEGMRAELISEYPGERWKKRVMDMPDIQVIAIYKRIDPARNRKPRKDHKKTREFEQIRFDI